MNTWKKPVNSLVVARDQKLVNCVKRTRVRAFMRITVTSKALVLLDWKRQVAKIEPKQTNIVLTLIY